MPSIVRKKIEFNRKCRNTNNTVNRRTFKMGTIKNFEMMSFSKISQNRKKIDLKNYKRARRTIVVGTQKPISNKLE